MILSLMLSNRIVNVIRILQSDSKTDYINPQIWNDFINHTEEEQERLLSADRHTPTMLDNDAVESQDLDDSWEQLTDNRAGEKAENLCRYRMSRWGKYVEEIRY